MVSISIKSEIDSRVLLYPMMRCLKPLGSVLVVTSNRQVSRLIDGDYEGDFRNFHILVDTDGATDELLEDAGVTPEEYTFVVYDNVGVVQQDKLIIPIGPIVSELFESEMMYLGEDKDTHILRFGRAVKKKQNKAPKREKSEKVDTRGMTKEEKKALQQEEAQRKKEEREALKAAKREQSKSAKSSRGNKKTKDDMTEDEIEEATRKKFQPKKEDITMKLKKLPNLQFPKFDDIETFESNKEFFVIDKNFVKFFYAVFQEYIGVKEPYFMREVSRKDEGSSSLSQRQASG